MRADAIVHRLLADCRPLMHLSRWRALGFSVVAVIQAHRLGICAAGRAACTSSKPKHAIKRVDRLIGNPRLALDRLSIFAGLALRLIASKHPILLIDWTHLDARFSALVVSLPVPGRSIPLYAEAHPRTNYAGREIQHRFLENLRRILPRDTRPILVADAGFQAPWWKKVQDMGWDFVVRLGGSVSIQHPDYGWAKACTIYPDAGSGPKDFGVVRIVQRGGARARVILGVRFKRNPNRRPQPRRRNGRGTGAQRAKKRSQEPWVLVSSLTDVPPTRVHQIYALRMRIEESFRDLKNSRLGWSLTQTRAKNTLRWNNLLLVATLAMAVLIEVGHRCEMAAEAHQYQANSTRTRRVLSLFVLGRAVLARAHSGRSPPHPSYLSPRTFSVICGDP